MVSIASGLWRGAATIAAPGLQVWLRLRAWRGKEITARLPERLGIDAAPRPSGRVVWIHAASVGETMSILPVVDALLARDPTITALVTTGTVTSASLLARRVADEPAHRSKRMLHRFVPLDVPSWGRRFLDHWRPEVAVFVESELWPNLLADCRRRRIPTVLVNARLSTRSYKRWARLPGFARQLLGGFALIQARSPSDASRFADLGASNVTAPGDLKFAAPPLPANEAALADLQKVLGRRPVWLAASTHPGEEVLIFGLHRHLADRYPGLLTLVAPRHPDRGAQLAAQAVASGVAATRRSLGEPPPSAGVWIVDTLAEMGLWYRLAPIVYMGKTLLPPGGGQNPLEPARLGCAIAVGPYTANFEPQMEALLAAGGVARVGDDNALGIWVDAMLANPDCRVATARAAAAVASKDADLPDRTAAALLDFLASARGA